MFKQSQLAFVEEEVQLERTWDKLPEKARREVMQHYARLMARATVSRIREFQDGQEVDNEPGQR